LAPPFRVAAPFRSMVYYHYMNFDVFAAPAKSLSSTQILHGASRSLALQITMSFRMTAVSATSFFFPFATSRS
jgi:hypothetical protein